MGSRLQNRARTAADSVEWPGDEPIRHCFGPVLCFRSVLRVQLLVVITLRRDESPTMCGVSEKSRSNESDSIQSAGSD